MDELLQKIDVRRLLIAIAPFSSTPAKDWPVEFYRKFIHELDTNRVVNYIILGGTKDVTQAFPSGSNVYDTRGKTTLTETVELLRRMDCFIGGCSAPLHIVTAVGTPTVALYGATLSAK